MKISDIPRDDNGVRCEPGIEYTRYKWHPTCQFCGLQDFGKEAAERPDGFHMLNCKHRPLSMLPCHNVVIGKDKEGKIITESQIKRGDFVGQARMRRLKFPIRVMGVFYPKDKAGRTELGPDGKPLEIWWCHYRYTEVDVVDFVFTRDGWKPWFVAMKPAVRQPKTGPNWKNLHWQGGEE